MSKKFWRDALERIVNTAWQAVGGILLTYLESGADPLHMDWPTVLKMAGNAAALAVLKSLVAKKIGNSDSASLHPDV